jgi:hypothetical protein
MPDTEEIKKGPMVDIDTSGPEVDVDITEDKKENKEAAKETEVLEEEVVVEQEEKVQEVKPEENKPEIEEYSEE